MSSKLHCDAWGFSPTAAFTQGHICIVLIKATGKINLHGQVRPTLHLHALAWAVSCWLPHPFFSSSSKCGRKHAHTQWQARGGRPRLLNVMAQGEGAAAAVRSAGRTARTGFETVDTFLTDVERQAKAAGAAAVAAMAPQQRPPAQPAQPPSHWPAQPAMDISNNNKNPL